MSSVLLYHHLGLGDHIMCHGIVREYCKNYDEVTIFSKPHNYVSVAFMYRDIKNLTIIEGEDIFAEKFIRQNSLKYSAVVRVGFEGLDRNSGVPLEWQFYKLAGVPFEKKWSSFFIERDLGREQSLSRQLAPKNGYAFVHEDSGRHFLINRKMISPDYEILSPDIKLTDNIFDYCGIIEKAKEIHVIDSSFMFLIDCLEYDNPAQKLYIHRYSRENNGWQLPILKRDWHILNEDYGKIEPLKDPLRWLFRSVDIPLLRRIIRKFFWHRGWQMSRPRTTDLLSLIRRHIPGKSFIWAYDQETSPNIDLAAIKEVGAKSVLSAFTNTIEQNAPADILCWSGSLSTNAGLLVLLKKLRPATKEILIFNLKFNIKARKMSPDDIERTLAKAGFEAREKLVFPLEVCFVCRVVLTK